MKDKIIDKIKKELNSIGDNANMLLNTDKPRTISKESLDEDQKEFIVAMNCSRYIGDSLVRIETLIDLL